MAKVVIDAQKCKGCLLCVEVCPKKLIRVSAQLNRRGINPVECANSDACAGCAMCALMCPDCCIEIEG